MLIFKPSASAFCRRQKVFFLLLLPQKVTFGGRSFWAEGLAEGLKFKIFKKIKVLKNFLKNF